MPPLADPAAGKIFGSSGDRHSGMLGERIEVAVATDVAEDECVALASPHLQASLYEQCFPTFVIIVEISECSQDAAVRFGEPVDMRVILLPRPVAQNLQRFALLYGGLGEGCKPAVDRVGGRVLDEPVDWGAVGGADRIGHIPAVDLDQRTFVSRLG